MISDRRKQMLRLYDHLYEYPDPTAKRCHYCGDKSTSVDHIPALDLVDRLGVQHFSGTRFIKVQACKNCNSLLSNLDKPMPERIEFLRLKLGEIYRACGTPTSEPERDKKAKLLRRLIAIGESA